MDYLTLVTEGMLLKTDLGKVQELVTVEVSELVPIFLIQSQD